MKHGEVRIIGGEWRGRKLKFPAVTGLRPTPDRVRETLFNWLTPMLTGARCLDLFSGSGALGFEALSRGANYVLFIEQAQPVIAYLQQQIAILRTQQADVYAAHIPTAHLPQILSNKPFDIIFLDPPFKQNLIKSTCRWLIEQHLLTPNSYIYIEAEKELNPLPVPAHWEIIKNKTHGQVSSYLFLSN